MKELVRIGENAWGHMAYQDQETGKYYIDLNDGFGGATSLYACSPSDDMDGEPDYLVKEDYKIVNPVTDREKRMKKYEFQYMMLGRLIEDCRAFFGDGRGDRSMDCRYHNECFIWGSSIKHLVSRMKELWNQIPEDIKPEWMTWEEVEEFEKQAEEYA